MGQRVVRVNELLKREISALLHTRYRGRAVAITITEVDTAPNLRQARVYYAVLGDATTAAEAEVFFHQHGREIRSEVGKVIVLKYLPHLEFLRDSGVERGQRLDAIFDELGLEEAPRRGPASPSDPSLSD
jgi:ribosome-binding factor A